MSYDNDNVFAKILRGEAPAFTVYETDQALAFMDVMPQVPGHTLVIPKDSAEGLHDVDPVILGGTIVAVQTVANAVKQAFDAPGIMIAQLNGPAAGQTVFHMHFHIMPRSEGLEFKLHAREMEDFAVLEAHARRIRAALEGSHLPAN
ncbi:MAG: HIT family protein [Halioglobus sp.]|nr:HIT family protein [Halioglobus sp.]